jgi:hypothetical protein
MLVSFLMCVAGSATGTTVDRYSLALSLWGLGVLLAWGPREVTPLSSPVLNLSSELPPMQSSGAITAGTFLQAIRFPKDKTQCRYTPSDLC